MTGRRGAEEERGRMPLRCLDGSGQSLQSFDFSEDEWQALARENRKTRHLRMPCCAAQVTLKTSPRGTRFFAHKARGPCTTTPETEAHLRLKRMAVVAARANGWTAETEIVGTTPDGEQWKADVLARKGTHKVAVEVQWSSQRNDETLRRQERYRRSGIRGLWLLRQPGFPITRRLPAVCVGGSVENGFAALIPHHQYMNARDRSCPKHWHQTIEMDRFLDAVFSNHFRFGIPVNVKAIVSVRGADMMCWSCGAETKIVTRIKVAFGPVICDFSIYDIGQFPKLIPEILHKIPITLGIGKIKYRFSKTLRERYLSNGCAHCGALIGQHFVLAKDYDATTLHNFPTRISEVWREAIESRSRMTWNVYPPIVF